MEKEYLPRPLRPTRTSSAPIVRGNGRSIFTNALRRSSIRNRRALSSSSFKSTSSSRSDESSSFKKGRVTIMRGIPGSGKSYLARSIAEKVKNGVVCSADDYFVDKETGEYRFNFRKLQAAHAQCMTRFLDALLANVRAVVVDNTNTRTWEYSHYEKIAKLSGYDLHIVEINCPNERVAEFCGERNGHNVPIPKVKQMWRRFERDDRADVRRPYGVPDEVYSSDALTRHRRTSNNDASAKDSASTYTGGDWRKKQPQTRP